jgi:hypothetical protein
MEASEPAALLDQVIYTASLVSHPEEIDAILDPLRILTANLTGGEKVLSEQDNDNLRTVQQELEEYLVTREQLRFFTPESLQLQVEQHMRGDSQRKSQKQVAGVVIIAPIVAITAALLPGLANVQQRGLVFGATTFSLVTVGAAWLFLTALSSFRSKLRRAFIVICSGVTVLGLSLLGQPIMEVFNLRHHPIVSLLYSTPILIAAILFHSGDTLYVRLLGIKNFWTTAWPIIIAGIPLTVLTLLAPHLTIQEPPLIYHTTALIWAWMLLTPIASAIILSMAIGKVPELYKPPIRHLFQSMFTIIAVVAYQYIIRVVDGPYMKGPVAYVLFGLVTLMGLALLRAGYTFNKVSRY